LRHWGTGRNVIHLRKLRALHVVPAEHKDG